MNKKEFNKTAFEKVLTLDGAIGTMLHAADLDASLPPDIAALEVPEKLREIHLAYIDAGANVIMTNTFGASPLRLKEYNKQDKTEEINQLSLKIAREAAREKTLVAATIGPSGEFVKPLGSITFDEAYDNFHRQAAALSGDNTPDFIILETFSDILELKAAVIACKDIFDPLDVPVVAQMSFQEDGRSVTGTDPETFTVIMEALGVDGIGVNCSVGPAEMLTVVKKLSENTHLPVSVEPNAGLPRLVSGKAMFDLTPSEFSEYVLPFFEAGASLIGSCCGSTPEFTREIARITKGKKPVKRKPHVSFRLASRTRTETFNADSPIKPIGERINPAGKKHLKAELRQGIMNIVRREAIAQEDAEAAALDINVSAYKVDEKTLLASAVDTVQACCNLPIVLDNSNPEVLETALKKTAGKPLINSTSGEEDKLEPLIKLAKRYGAAIVGITLDENGIPETAQERFKIAEKIIEASMSFGLARENLLIDTLVLSASTGPEKLEVTLEALKKVKKELSAHTVLGISNCSFGLPNRPAMNATFLALALQSGLDIPIIDPLDRSIQQVLVSFNLLNERDPGGKRYIARMSDFQPSEDESDASLKEESDLPILDRIKRMVITGDKANIVDAIEKAKEQGHKSLEIVDQTLVPAMTEVGRLFNDKRYFLPQVILSAETMKKGFERLKNDLAKEQDTNHRGVIIFATVRGDIHDLGKNIVITLLESNGFKVMDLGKSVPAEEIIKAAKNNKADFIALSALMTTTMSEMANVTRLADEKNIKIPVIVGGAVVNKNYAAEIGAEYGKDAIEAVKIISELEKRIIET